MNKGIIAGLLLLSPWLQANEQPASQTFNMEASTYITQAFSHYNQDANAPQVEQISLFNQLFSSAALGFDHSFEQQGLMAAQMMTEAQVAVLSSEQQVTVYIKGLPAYRAGINETLQQDITEHHIASQKQALERYQDVELLNPSFE